MEKETIELVKKMIEDGNLSQEIAEKYCPELKESEDERIRKVIADIVKAQPSDSLFNGTKEKCLAWLEKQGEQKYMKTCAEYYNQDNEWKMPELSEFQDKLADILMHREYDGPDETEDDIAKGRLEYELAAIRLSEELLPLAQKEQSAPKPSWSEEDETHRHWILEMLKDGEIKTTEFGDHFRAAFNSLKYLRPQNRWKPSDEQMEAIKNDGEYKVREG